MQYLDSKTFPKVNIYHEFAGVINLTKMCPLLGTECIESKCMMWIAPTEHKYNNSIQILQMEIQRLEKKLGDSPENKLFGVDKTVVTALKEKRSELESLKKEFSAASYTCAFLNIDHNLENRNF